MNNNTIFEVKLKPGISNRNIEEELMDNISLNDFIDREVYDSKDWVFYADSKFFDKEYRITSYRDIKIQYNDFILSDNIVILNKLK